MYPWIVFLHVLGGFGFVLAHGASAFVAFALLRERNVDRIRALLDLSKNTQGALYGSLILLLVAGVVAGFMGPWWGSGWIWTALGLLILITILMFAIATRYYVSVRKAAGLPYVMNGKPMPAEPPVSPAEMETLLAASPAGILSAVGFGGLAIILWLMMLKPF